MSSSAAEISDIAPAEAVATDVADEKMQTASGNLLCRVQQEIHREGPEAHANFPRKGEPPVKLISR